MSAYDYPSLFDFLLHTPEKGLRKMLVDPKQAPKNMTDVHFQLLIKIIRSGPVEDFAKYFQDNSFPKVKYSPAEQKIKEQFWADCEFVLKSRGLLTAPTVTKVAA